MSLDVYLLSDTPHPVDPTPQIFLREDVATRQISPEEWHQRFPDREPVTLVPEPTSRVLYHGNITHNLGTMAAEAGLYQPLWRPQELGITTAAALRPLLLAGVIRLLEDPEHYALFNPPNGWGDYAGLVRFVKAYLRACRQYPEATVEVSV